MRENLKHIVEIAGGLVIGALASDMVDELIKIAKTKIADHKEKKES